MATYGRTHHLRRRMMLPDAWGQPCPRCGRVMFQDQPLDLDHGDPGHEGYLGIVHSSCNRAAGGALGRQRKQEYRRAAMERQMIPFERCAIGVEISEGRLHTSIGVAGTTSEGPETVLALAAYLTGTGSALTELLKAMDELQPTAVVIDPHGQAATLIGALEKLKIKNLKKPQSGDMVVAHGNFLDELNAGKLRHREHPRLTDAARAGAQRRLGGAEVWDKRTEVDSSPLTAVTLALWGLRTAKPTPPPLVIL